MKIVTHSLDHNEHYSYFRRYFSYHLGHDNEITHLIQRNDSPQLLPIDRIQRRLLIEFRLSKLAIKNGEFLIYLSNRFLSIFFGSLKKEYDHKKLSKLDNYFRQKNLEIGELKLKTLLINNINEEEDLLAELRPDLLVVVGAPFIKKNIISLPFKKINLHLGLLPYYRGIKTIEWAIINGDIDKVGYSVHNLTSELDSGALIKTERLSFSGLIPDLPRIYINLYEKSFESLKDIVEQKSYLKPTVVSKEKYKIYNSYKFNPLFYSRLMKNKIKMLIYVGNPVQYHAPIFRALAEENDIESTVMFGDDIGLRQFYSKEFQSYIQWDVPLVDGYQTRFFKNLASKNSKGFFSRINIGMFGFIIKNRPDVLLVHGYDTMSSVIAFVAAKIIGSKILWRGEAAIRPNTRQGVIRKLVKSYVLPIYFRYCDAIMFSCAGNRLYLEQFSINPQKLFFMPCAVDNKFFRRHEARHAGKVDTIRDELGIRSSVMVIAFVARFTQRKRPLDLIEAVSMIDHKDIHVLFVGDGPEREEMEQLLAKHRVSYTITGFVGQNKLAAYLAIADLFVISSDYDASPKSLNEALNFGLPVIVSDAVGTAADLVRDGWNGFVFPSRDLKTLSSRLELVVGDRALLPVMGERSRTLVDSWTIEADVAGLRVAIESVIFKGNRSIDSGSGPGAMRH